MSAAVNSMIGAQSGSIGRGAEYTESRALQRTRLVFGSIAVEIAAPGAASNRPFQTGAVGSELMVGADT